MVLVPDQEKPLVVDNVRNRQRRFRINSLSARLFLVITGSVLLGMGGMAILFGETVKYQAEDQIESALESKVSTINDVIDQAETLAYGLNVSVTTLHVRRAETEETYQELVRQLFQGRPRFVTGLGFGQSRYGILPSQEWLFPYYQADSVASDAELLAPATEGSYIDRAAPEYFYPDSSLYRDYFLPQRSLWTTPYQSDRGDLLTYYSQMFDPQGKWLGTAVIDVDAAYLSQVLDEPILRNGGRLILLSSTGDVIANPSQASNLGNQTYQDIPGLSKIWLWLDPELPGFLEGETGYWAYTQIPERDWLLVAYVPYRTVFGQVMLITLGATTVVGLLMAAMVALVIRYLNRRLKPTLSLCQRLADMDSVMMQQLKDKDEIDQLSASFFYLLEKQQQQPTTVEQATQRIRLLSKALSMGEGKLLSQWAVQAQQWAEATSNVAQALKKQSSRATTVEKANREALEVCQRNITSAMTKLEALRQSIPPTLEQTRRLATAADISTEMREKLGDLFKVSEAFISKSPSLFPQATDSEDSDDLRDKITLFRGFVNRLKGTLDELSQMEAEQSSQQQRAESIGVHLRKSINTFDVHLRELTNAIEAAQSLFQHSQTATNQVAYMGEQGAESSRELETLSQAIQQSVQDVIASGVS